MENSRSENKRIARNSMFMYIRMGFSMFVGLFTSRVVLQNLGVNDFGIYNVVGGIITMFSFLNGCMSNTTSRYITVYIGKGDVFKTRQIFNMASIIHGFIAILILILGETIGLWYLHNKMVIPEGRMYAAEWLYQLSVMSSILSILAVPYNAAIVAHEKMGIFAGIQILNIILKLCVVVSLSFAPFDKLIYYGTLLSMLSIINLLIHITYCKRHFEESSMLFFWDKKIFKEMIPFAGWALIGNFSYVFFSQGINLMLNFFCGPVVNAARGIALQIEGVLREFTSNIQVAINPQIIKSYASNRLDRMYTLIFASSRFCFYLFFLLSLPIMIEIDYILKIWLEIVPEHTVNFVRLTLMLTLLDAFINPMYTANLASGKLKMYNLSVCAVSYSFMIVTYLSIRFTKVPESVFVCLLVSTMIGVIVRIFVLNKQIGLKVGLMIKNVFSKVLIVIVASVPLPIIIHNTIGIGILRLVIVCILTTLSIVSAVFCFGVDKDERDFIKNKIKTYTRNKFQIWL